MERTISVEDRIRRAEEIYYRRKQKEIPKEEYGYIPERKTIKKEKKNIRLLKKMINQIIVCLIIYSVFYMIINNNYIFSEDFSNKLKEIMSYDIDIQKFFSYITVNGNKILEKMNSNKQSENKEQNSIDNNQNLVNNEENIGGAEEQAEATSDSAEDNLETSETEQNEQVVELTQMEQDALYIKNSINFIKPVEGVISSKFGLRNPTVETVPKNHTGTDIAANLGTPIVSATEGTVILASSEGDYGNHLKIQVNDIVILYAHCKELLVKEGDAIQQGQAIATVGSTGNSTGPHLHFEIRYQDRYVDPELILQL